MKTRTTNAVRVLGVLMLCAGLLLSGCYDDSALRDQLNDYGEQLSDHESRLKELERLCSQANTNIEALQTIVSALQEKDYVTGIAPIKEGDAVLGYTITFSKSDAVTIYHGKDGQNGNDGYVPALGVKQDTDQQWYWTVDGEWLCGSNGEKVRASAIDGQDGKPGNDGAAGVTPTLKIEEGYWYVSFDGGKTWETETLGQATGDKGDSMFGEVTYDADYVYITLADGQELVLPRTSVSQSEGPGNEGSGETNDIITITSGGVTLTVMLRNLTETGVAFYGVAELAKNYTASSFGILYSEEETFTAATAQSLQIVDIYGTNYSVSTSSLKPSTTYYYTLYIKQGDLYKYGEIKSFTTATLVAPSLDDATDVTEVSAIISGTVSLASGSASDLEYGFQYSTAEDFSIGVTSKKITDIDSEYKFSLQISSLVPAEAYYYRSYIKTNGVYGYGEIKSFTTAWPLLSLNDVIDVTVWSAVISGTVSLAPGLAYDLEYGFQYSTTEDFSTGLTSKKITDIDSENKFSIRITSLVPAEAYYYRSYIKMNGVYGYGEIKSFTTASLVAPELSPVLDIKYSSALINGKAKIPSMSIDELDEAIACEYLHFGVLYSNDSSLSYESSARGILFPFVHSILPEMLISELSLEARLEGLTPETTYYYCSYLYLNGKVVLGKEKTFTTLPDLYGNQTDLNIYSAADLSLSSSANCYIISESGLYKFKTVKGSSSESVGNVASASILWETYGTDAAPEQLDLINGVCYKDDYIVFHTADTFKEGNAVIAAKDANGNILWSWHIWLTDQPQGQEYYNNAGTMMDRNLGATSATPGDVGALGLLYQWGRKDPFLSGGSISSSTQAESTISWPSAVSSNSSNGTIAYATANPTTFITCNYSNWDWYYTGSSSTDNTRWTTSESNKSIYDPCPPGWRVPDGGNNGVWSKALGSSYTKLSYDSANEGMNFSGKFGVDQTIWYPASGCRNAFDGRIFGDVGYYGYYWSASPYSNYAYILYFDYDGSVFPSYDNARAYGESVRCLQVID